MSTFFFFFFCPLHITGSSAFSIILYFDVRKFPSQCAQSYSFRSWLTVLIYPVELQEDANIVIEMMLLRVLFDLGLTGSA